MVLHGAHKENKNFASHKKYPPTSLIEISLRWTFVLV